MFLSLAILITGLLAWPCPASAEVFKVVDEKGRVTYTDRPPPQEQRSEQVDLPKTNVQPALTPTPLKRTENQDQETGYRSLSIIQPEADTTVPPGQLDVIVQVAMEPTLRQGHRVLLLFDGQPYGEPVAATSFVLGNLFRGTHHVQVQIIDGSGNIMAYSASVPFHVKRASILNKPKS